MHGLTRTGVAKSVLQGRVMEHDSSDCAAVILCVNLRPRLSTDALYDEAQNTFPESQPEFQKRYAAKFTEVSSHPGRHPGHQSPAIYQPQRAQMSQQQRLIVPLQQRLHML